MATPALEDLFLFPGFADLNNFIKLPLPTFRVRRPTCLFYFSRASFQLNGKVGISSNHLIAPAFDRARILPG